MKVFLTGATGYIGGEVAARLVAAGHAVRGLTRSGAKAAALQSRGITPVVGSLDDGEMLAIEARAADAVINAADSDHAPAVDALLDGLGKSGKPFIHTSGISILADRAMGAASERIFDEETPFAPDPGKAARFAIDRKILAAGERLRAIVICNSLIYGRGQGLHPESIQIPLLAAEARRAGVVRHIGAGTNIWSNVHIADVAALYLLALERAAAGFFFAENGEASFAALTEALSRRLGFAGRTESWPAEEAIAALGFARAVFSLGSNCRVRARRARDLLGWAPQHRSVLKAIEAGDF